MIRRISQRLRAWRRKSRQFKLEAACSRVTWRGRGTQFFELLENRRLLSSVIDVQFGFPGGYPNATPAPAAQTGAAVVGTPADQWNTVSNTGYSTSNVALNDVNGDATGATISFTENAQTTSVNTPFAGSQFQNLMQSYLVAFGTQTVTFNGLVPNSTYDVIIYSGANSPGRVSTFEVNGVTETSNFDGYNNTFIIGDNYLDIPATVSPSGQLQITYAPGAVGNPADVPPEADFNGIQLVPVAQNNVIYVDQNANGANTGADWNDAFTDLQSALTAAAALVSPTNPVTIDVAQGTYVPSLVDPNPSPADGGSFNPTPTFVIPDGVILQGGFAGNVGGDENSGNPGATGFVSTLSGALPVPVNGYSNSWQVVDANNDDSSTVISGFTITGGDATGGISDLPYENVGGGLIAINGSPNIENNIFTGDQSSWGAAAIYLNGSSSELTNNTFTSDTSPGINGGPGGAVYTYAGNPNFNADSFANDTGVDGGAVENQYNSSSFANCIFNDNSATEQGGALSFYGANSAIFNCMFTGNISSDTGGAIETTFGNVQISDSYFAGNSATNEGGAAATFLTNFDVYGTTFANNSADQGGAIFDNNSTPIFDGDNFDANFTSRNPDPNFFYHYGGGAIVDYFSNTTITDSYFGGNYTLGGDENGHEANGGAIWTLADTTIIQGDNYGGQTVFVDNDAYSGGALYNNIFSSIEVSATNFEDNAAIQNGGAVDNEGINGPLQFNGCTFTSNMAFDGGAMYSTDANFTPCDPTLTGCTFTSNSAVNGGAMFNLGHPDPLDGGLTVIATDATLTNCTFISNSATNGGAIDDDEATLTISGGGFTNNYTDGGLDRGGAIFNYNSSSVTIDGDTDFNANQAYYGGAIADDDSTSSINGATFAANASGGAGSGGAIYDTDGSLLSLSDCLFANNITSNSGGAIDLSGSSATVSSTVFYSNNAAGDAGAILVSDGSSLTVDNTLFTGNTASSGGAIEVPDAASTLSVTDSQFTGNIANLQGLGGAVATFEMSPSFIGCAFTDNTANFGGAISAYGGSPGDPTTLFLVDTTFTGNTANNIAGAINSAFDNVVSAINCVFTNNSAQYAAGTVFLYLADGDYEAAEGFIDCVFSDNDVNSDDASAIATSAASPSIINCTFTGNTSNDGSTINGTNGSNLTITNSIVYGDIGSSEISGDGSGSTTVTYSDVEGGYSGAGNIDGNPDFVDAPSNLGLSADSAALNDGSYSAITATGVLTDVVGQPRTVDGTVDMGAYESTPVIYVNVNSPALPVDQNGFSWGTAYNNLQTALSIASAGDVIEVAAGTYYPTNIGGDPSISFVIPNGVALIGGWSGDPSQTVPDPAAYPTILSGFIGQPGTITGNSQVVVSISYADSSTLIDGFTITGGGNSENSYDGGGMSLQSASPTIENCTFIDNYAIDDGGAMIVYSSNPTIDNCSFLDNTALYGGAIYISDDSSVTINNSTFVDNIATGGTGGAISADNGYFYYGEFLNLTINNSVFSSNSSADDGGAIYNYFSTVTVTGSTFNDNSAYYGGAIYNYGNYDGGETLTNNVFTVNNAFSYGGAIYNEGSSPTISNNIFIGNTAYEGGAIYDYESSSPDITNSTFSDNAVTGDGGAILDVYSSSPTIANSTFTGNTADSFGGAIAEQEDSQSFFTFDEFNSNSAYEGGAISEQFDSTSTLDNLTFLDNTASGGGGAVYLDLADISFTGANEFDANKAYQTVNASGGGDGGGGAIYSLYSAFSTVGGDTFTHNSAKDGGAIFVRGTYGRRYYYGDPVSVSINGDEFDNNTATYNGGAIYNENSSNVLMVDSSTFLGNSTNPNGDDDGGAVFTKSSSATFDQCVFDDNSSGFQGGAMLVVGDDTSTIESCTFQFNTASGDGGAIAISGSSPMISDTLFDYNKSYGNGGAVFNSNGSPTFDSDTFFTNTADPTSGKSGGAIFDTGYRNNYATYYSSPLIENSTFTDNIAATGGAIDTNYSEATITGSTFSGDGAENQGSGGGTGGGIFTHESAVTLTGDNVLGDNAANGSGGAVAEYYNTGPSVISGCFFMVNAASSGNGGAVDLFHDGNTVTILNSVFDGNFAVVDGGAIYDFESNPTIFNCVFSNNYAFNTGGAIENDFSSPSIINCTFAGNTAINGGGAIFDYGSNYIPSDPTVVNSILAGDGPDEFGGNNYGLTTVSFSDVYGTYGNSYTFGPGVTLNNPQFVSTPGGFESRNFGILSVTPGSSAIGTGDYGALQNYGPLVAGDGTDVTGVNPRIVNPGQVDMGAYSYPSSFVFPIPGGPGLPYTPPIPGSPAGDTAPPPLVTPNQPDLTPQNVTVPAAIFFNAPITINWTDQNIGDANVFQAVGGAQWTDAVFMSATPYVTDNSVLLGVVPVSTASVPFGDLTPNSGIAVTGTFYLPHASGQLIPGSYYFIVETNIDGAVSESNLQNNAATATGTVNVIAKTIYVDVNSPVAGNFAAQDGTTWATAYSDLQYVLNNVAQYGDIIDVAQGTYEPSDPNVTSTFMLPDGVTIQGGFAGNAGGNENGGNPGEFNPSLFPTILSTSSDNYAIVTADNVNNMTVLENVTIEGGYNNGDYGGGLYVYEANPTFNQDIFTDNYAYEGGAAYLYYAAPTFNGCDFTNTPDTVGDYAYYGGAVYMQYTYNNASPQFNNSVFSDNFAYYYGGAIYSYDLSPSFNGSTFTDNTNEYDYGGAIYAQYGTVNATNTIFSSNYAVEGGAIYTAYDTSLDLTGCTFTHDTASESGSFIGGGAIYMDDNYYTIPSLTDCTFLDNSAYQGGAIYDEDTSPELVNCLFVGNTADFGGAIFNYYNSSPTIINCTFSANVASMADGGGAIYNEDNSDPTIKNSILYGDGPNEIGNYYANSVPNSGYTAFYSDIQGGAMADSGGGVYAPVNGDISLNPDFFGGGDYQLAPISPDIDAGDNSFVPNGVTTDLIGNPRIVDAPFINDVGGIARVDMGAYEYQPGPDQILPDLTPTNLSDGAITSANFGDVINLSWTDQNTGTVSTGIGYTDIVYLSTTPWVNSNSVVIASYNEPVLAAGAGININETFTLPAATHAIDDGTYYLVVEDNGQVPPLHEGSVQNNIAATSSITLTNNVFTTIFVDVNTPAPLVNQNGQSWGSAFASLQAALNEVVDGDTIDVAQGTYLPSIDSNDVNNFDLLATFLFNNLDQGVTIQGGFAGHENPGNPFETGFVSILSGALGNGDLSETVVTVENNAGAPTILNGFTIEDGQNYGANNQHGGGMYISDASPTIENCIFTGNYAYQGGAVYLTNSTAMFSNCTFTSNNASDGGAVFVDGASPTFSSCGFTDNSAYYGGAVDISDTANPVTFTSCSFAGNYAYYYGGAVYAISGSLTINGASTFTDNYSYYAKFDGYDYVGGAMYLEYSTLNATGVSFSGNLAGEGGAIYSYDTTLDLTHCTFASNVAVADGGGAIYENYCPNSTISYCTFSGNTADNGSQGGAIASYDNFGTLVVSACTFLSNTADEGGAIFIESYFYYYTPPELLNCLFEGNNATYGGAIYNFDYAATRIVNGTFNNNNATVAGEAIYDATYSSPIIANSILYGDTSNDASTEIAGDGTGTPTVTYSDVDQSGYGLGGASPDANFNIDADPLFIDAPNNLHVEATSPVINTGSVAALPAGDTTDLSGNARTVNVGGTYYVDMGAYEFATSVPAQLQAVNINTVSESPLGDFNAGSTVNVTYNDENTGETEVDSPWTDYVYLSTTPDLTGSTTLLGTVNVPVGTDLNNNQSTGTLSAPGLTLPANLTDGYYYIVIETAFGTTESSVTGSAPIWISNVDTWTGGGAADTNWSDAANWSAAYGAPTSGDTAYIPFGSDFVVNVDGNDFIANLDAAGDTSLTINSGDALTVQYENSKAAGNLTVSPDATLTATGQGTTFSDDGSAATTIDGGNLYAQNGATLTLSNVTTANADASGAQTTWEASNGGELSLPNLTSASGNYYYYYYYGYEAFQIIATSDGTINLPALQSISGGNFSISASGIGTSINMPVLQTLDSTYGISNVSASNGSTISTPDLTDVIAVDESVDATSVVNYSQIVDFNDSNVTVTGQLENFTSMLNADGSGFYANGGAVLNVPVATYNSMFDGSYDNATWEATGAGSQVNFANLTSINAGGAPAEYLTVDVNNNGAISLPNITTVSGANIVVAAAGTLGNLAGVTSFTNSTLNVTSHVLGLPAATDIDGSSFIAQGGAVIDVPIPTSYANVNQLTTYFEANGAGSQVTLNALVNINDGTSQYLTVEAINGGAVLLPAVQTVSGADFVVDAASSLSSTAGITSFIYSTLNVTGHILGLPNATDIDGSSFIAGSGATISVPAATNYNTESYDAQFTANTGGTISLPNLSTISGGVVNNYGYLNIEANGGNISMPSLGSMVSDYYQSTVFATSGGAITVGNQFAVTNVAVELSPTGSILFAGNAATASLTLNGNSVLDGAGTLDPTVYNVAGEVSPGGNGSVGAIKIVGNYIQDAGGSVQFDFGGITAGNTYDLLTITGSATLDGTANLDLVNGFSPSSGTNFTPLTSTGLSGVFATVNGVDQTSVELNPSYTPDDFVINAQKVGVVMTPVSASAGVPLNLVQIATVYDLNPGVTANTIGVSVDWNYPYGPVTSTSDGNGDVIVNGSNGTFYIDASYTYFNEGTYILSISVNDGGGAIGTASEPVHVPFSPLSAVAPSQSFSVAYGQAFDDLVAVFTNSGDDGFNTNINWGDGNITGGTAILNEATNQIDVYGSHTYTTGVGTTYNPVVTITGQQSGKIAMQSASITVTQATPSVVVNAPNETYNAAPYSQATATVTGVGGVMLTDEPVNFTYYVTGSNTPIADPTSAGTYDVTATYPGDTDYSAQTSSRATFTIFQATPSVVVHAPNETYNAAPYSQATATVTGVGGVMLTDETVTFTYYVTGSNTPIADPTSAGTYDVTATYPGDTNYSAQTSSRATFTIFQATPSVVVHAPNETYNAAPYSQATATVTGVGGVMLTDETVTFTYYVTGSNTPIADPTSAGTYDVTATYPGDTNYSAQTSSRATFTIFQATPSVVVHAPNETYNAAPYSQATATVTGVGGVMLTDETVTFTYYVTGSNTPIADPTSAGTYDVTATYPGDTNYSAQTSSRATFTIFQATPSVVVHAPNETYNAAPYSQATATVTGVGGVMLTDETVTFTYYVTGSNTPIADPTSAGTYDVTATYPGDTNYSAQTSSRATFTIFQATPSVVVHAPNETYNAAPYSQATATVTGIGGVTLTDETVTFTYYVTGSNTPIADPTSAGTYDVTATYPGDTNYSAQTSSRATFTIFQATPSVVVNAPNETYNAAPYSQATATVTGIGGVTLTDETVTFTYYVTGSNTPIADPTSAGTYDVTATYPGDTNYSAQTSSRATFTIFQATPSVVVNAPNETYNAAPYSQATATVTGGGGVMLTDETVTFTYYVTGSNTPIADPTSAGTYDVTATYPGDTNYSAQTSSRATFTIYQATPSVVVHAPNETYNAAPYSQATATVTGVGGVMLTDETVTFTYYVTGSNTPIADPTSAGTYDVTATYPGDTNYSAQTSSRATFTIFQATPSVVVNAPNETYNAAPYSQATATVTGVGGVMLTDETVTFTYYVTGSNTPIADPTTAGTYDVTATYPGDTNYSAQTSSRATFTIFQATPTVSATAETISYTGLPYPNSDVTVSVTGVDDTPITDGSYTFTYYDSLGDELPDNGAAPTTAGNYSVVVGWSGDTNYAAASSTMAPFTITPASNGSQAIVSASAQSITYDAAPYPNSDVTVAVTGAGDTPITDGSFTYIYYDSMDNELPDNGAAPTNAGNYSVVVDWSGDTNYAASASNPAPFTIFQATPSVVVNAPNETYNAAPYSQATATVTGVGGVMLTDETVTFTYYVTGSNTPIADPTSAGTYDVTATYPGDTNYSAQTSSRATFTIFQATPSVVVNAPNETYNAAPYSQATATVTGVGGVMLTDETVTFTYYVTGSNTPIADPTSAGTYDVTATYPGDTNYSAQTSSRATFTIFQATPSVVVHAPNETYNAAPYSQATATVTGVGGVMLTDETVTFTYYVTGSNTPIADPTSAGTYDVTATYPGDTNYSAQTSSRATFTIFQATPSVVVHAPNETYNAAPYSQATATVTGVGGVMLTDETVTFTYYVTGSNTPIADPTSAGTYDVTATYPGDTNYSAQTSSRATFTIFQATPSVVVHAPNETYNAAPYSQATATVTGVGGVMLTDETVTFTYYVTGSNTPIADPTSAGTYDVTATYPGDTNYSAQTSSRATFTIFQATPSVVVHAPNETFNAAPYSQATATVTGVGGVMLTDETVTFTYYLTGSNTPIADPTSAGTYDVTATYPGDTNYSAQTSSRATFTIFQATPSVVVNAPNETYNAAPYSQATATVTGVGGVMLTDETVTFTYYVTGSNTPIADPTSAGTYDVTATYPGDTNYSAQTSSRATFTIFQATPSVVVHAPNETYNAAPYSQATATVTGVGGVMLTDETVTFTYYVTGSNTPIADPTSAGTYDVTATYPGDTNYSAQTSSRATFTIFQATPSVVVNAPNETYNAAPYSQATATVTGVGGVMLTDETVTFTYYVTGSNTPIADPTSAGTYDVTATYPGDTNYSAQTSSRATFTIFKATPSVVVTAPNVTANGSPYSAATTKVTGVGGVTLTDETVTYTYYTQSAPTVPIADPSSPGSYYVVATYPGDANYSQANSSLTPFTISSTIQNVTSSVSITHGASVYSPVTKVYTQSITIKNTSGSTINGPISLVLQGLNGLTLTNATGVTTAGDPAGAGYYYLNASVSSLAAGASVTFTLTFSDPNAVVPSYTAVILAGPGTR
jgi:hypothetical protein